ncbi:MAG: PQQ-dependent sugar dehydrogenase [Phycisphaeraceae bacterium]|nr:MAG: PQQ-dependent sugar dehydrogenase [Phycisphaeraceae bacterium]
MRVSKAAVLSFLAGCAGLGGATFGQTSALVASGFTRPIAAVSAPGRFDRLFIVEQFSGTTGRIQAFNTTTNTRSEFLSVSPVTNGNEQGLLGLAFHPRYQENGKFYVYYTDSSARSVVEEYRVSAGNPDQADPASARLILRFSQPQENHNGGWIAFGPDGYLYIASGDGGGANDSGSGHTTGTGNAQDITANWLGKMLRVDVDRDDFPADANRNYGVPSSNPFVGVTGDDEIWSFGLRNPWRNSFDRLTGELWIADVGQDAWEEINREPAGVGGRNYGWRCMEGLVCTGLTGCTCNAVALTLPVHVYQHVSNRCSVTGGYVYRGCAIPSLYGKYVFADYCTGEVWAMNTTTYEVVRLFTASFGVTSFGEDAFGELWFTRQGGQLRKIVAAAGETPFNDCNANGRPDCWDIADGTASDCNGNGIPDSCEPVCGADFNGDCFVDFFDLDAFVQCFEGEACPPGKDADFNGDGFVDFFDLDAFVEVFEAGC